MGRPVPIRGEFVSVCLLSGWGSSQRSVGSYRVEKVYLNLAIRYVHVEYLLFLFLNFVLMSVVVLICVQCVCRIVKMK